MFDDELKSPLSKDALNVKKEADNGNVDAMHLYATMLAKGIGVPKNTEEAVKYFKMGIERGDQRSMLNYAIMLHDGDGIPVDKVESARIIRMAPDIPQAVFNLASMLLNGDGIPQDKKEGLKLLKKAAEMGDINAMKSLSVFYSRGEICPVDLEKSAYYSKMAADCGDVESIFRYGEMLSEGVGVTNSKIGASIYLKAAADCGSVKAMVNYGIMLIDGEGIPVDYNEGMKYLKMAADKNFPNAYMALFLAIFRFNGYPLDNDHFFESVNKYFLNPISLNNDMKDAITYIKKAADLNDNEAIFYYGFMNYFGFTVDKNKEEGMKYIKKAYENGKKDAFNLLACFALSSNTPESREDGYLFFRMSADKGDVLSMQMLSKIFLLGDIISKMKDIGISQDKYPIIFENILKNLPKDTTEGKKYLKMAADSGDIFSMKEYSEILFEENNITEGLKYLKMAADKGDVYSMLLYGAKLTDKDVIKNKEVEGATYVRMAADRGDFEAFCKYAELLYLGLGVKINKKGAAKYYKLAADGGVETAMYCYARMLRHGEGIPKNIEESIKYYKMAIDKGNAKAMINYAHMLFNGEGIPVDKKEAYKYYKMSADTGYTNAMIDLGKMYFYGDGIPMNKEEGLRYYKQAADLGNHESMFIYGKILYEGDTIPANKKEGYEYIKKSADSGYEIAISYLNYLKLKEFQNTTNNKRRNDDINYAEIDLDRYYSKFKHDSNEPTTKTINDITIYTYPTLSFKNNQFLYISEFSFSHEDFKIIDQTLQKLSSYKSKHGNMIHPEDPNKLYTFYFFFTMDSARIIFALNEAITKCGVKVEPIILNQNLYFEENMINPEILNIIFEKLKKMPEITSIKRNIFDGRQIATYVYANSFNQKRIIDSLRHSLLKENIIIDTSKYPLMNNIIINESLILENNNDFNIIVNEIKSIGINPIDVQRNKLYLYNEYHLKKLFQVFSFICFKNENEKMEALNHINSILFRNKPNVLKYKLNLHYATINDVGISPFIHENIVSIFESFDGVEDIQYNVLSIESPCIKTYVGFDTMSNLKKAFPRYMQYKCLSKPFTGLDYNFFIPKKNLIYLKIKTDEDDIELSRILYSISRNASDFQENCSDNSSFLDLNSSYLGFNTRNKYKKVYDYLYSHPKIRKTDISEYVPKNQSYCPVNLTEEQYIYYEGF